MTPHHVMGPAEAVDEEVRLAIVKAQATEPPRDWEAWDVDQQSRQSQVAMLQRQLSAAQRVGNCELAVYWAFKLGEACADLSAYVYCGTSAEDAVQRRMEARNRSHRGGRNGATPAAIKAEVLRLWAILSDSAPSKSQAAREIRTQLAKDSRFAGNDLPEVSTVRDWLKAPRKKKSGGK